MKNNQKNASGGSKEKLVPITIRLSKPVYFGLKRLSEEHGVSFAHTVRLAAEGELENYFGSVRYKDRTQAAELMAAGKKLSEICLDIVNNARRIGFNFSQELRLKEAKEKYYKICNDSRNGKFIKDLAADEYIKKKDEIEKTCFNKNELNKFIERFKAAADKVEELSWNIHE